MIGTVSGHRVILETGLSEDEGVSISELAGEAEDKRKGQTIMFVAVDGRPAGFLGVSIP